jgi:hypothetical protein
LRQKTGSGVASVVAHWAILNSADQFPTNWMLCSSLKLRWAPGFLSCRWDESLSGEVYTPFDSPSSEVGCPFHSMDAVFERMASIRDLHPIFTAERHSSQPIWNRSGFPQSILLKCSYALPTQPRATSTARSKPTHDYVGSNSWIPSPTSPSRYLCRTPLIANDENTNQLSPRPSWIRHILIWRYHLSGISG